MVKVLPTQISPGAAPLKFMELFSCATVSDTPSLSVQEPGLYTVTNDVDKRCFHVTGDSSF